MQGIKSNQEGLNSWLGKYLTEGKRPDPALLEAYDVTPANSLPKHSYQADADYQRFPGTRMAYIQFQDKISLFVGGNEYFLDPQHLQVVQYLCDEQHYTAPALAPFSRAPAIAELINTLIKNNNIVLMEQDLCDEYTEPSPCS